MHTPSHNAFLFSVSGRVIDLVDPRPDSFDIEDVAHALAMQPRFNGNTRQHYSIAQHSVLVSRIVPCAAALAALLHDAAEAITGDVVSPVKALIKPLFAPIEARLMAAIHARFGLPATLPPSVAEAIHIADLAMLAREKQELFDFDTGHWPILEAVTPSPLWTSPMSSELAKADFLARFHELVPARRIEAA